jgi:hypothetical protein
MRWPLPEEPELRTLLVLALAASGCVRAAPESSVPPSRATPTAATDGDPGAGTQAGAPSADACDRGQLAPGVGLRPGAPVDGWAIVTRQVDRMDPSQAEPNQGEVTVQVFGEPCRGASDPAACAASLSAAPSSGALRAKWGQIGGTTWTMVSGVGGVVTTVATVEDLRAFLGPIDAPGDAATLAWALGYDPTCPAPAAVDDGFRVTARHDVSDCPMTHHDVIVHVQSSGSHDVEIVARHVSGACVGRLPPMAAQPPELGDGIGAWLARAAWLEAQAVHAFAHLERELRHHGAPRVLLTACAVARADEERHAVAMRALAEARGAEVPSCSPAPLAVRSLAEIAVDNAFEGLARETWGAVIGAHQAELALDPEVRAAMGAIAPDEARHAELARAIAAWIGPRLSVEERARAHRAHRRGLAAVRSGVGDDGLSAAERAALGLPGLEGARAMAARIAA